MVGLYRAMTPAERLEKVWRLNASLRAMQRCQLHERHPDMTPHEEKMRMAALRIPRDLMIKAYGWDPEVHGY